MNKNMQDGRSMMEMLGVLAIVGVLSVGGFSLVNKMQTSNKINAVMDEVSTLARKVRPLARDYEGEIGLINNKVREMKAYPDSFFISETDDAAGSDSFYGTDDVEFNVYYYRTKRMLFILELKGVSTEMCMQLVTTNWGSASNSGFIGLSVNDENYYNIDYILDTKSPIPAKIGIAGNKDRPVPMGIGTATDICTDNSTLRFAFR